MKMIGRIPGNLRTNASMALPHDTRRISSMPG
jgi:hypothetical protein